MLLMVFDGIIIYFGLQPKLLGNTNNKCKPFSLIKV